MHNNILIIFTLFFIINCSARKFCQSPEGNEVDWYVIFFMPKAASSDEEIYYAYFDDTLNSLEYYLYEEIFFPPSMITSYVIENFYNEKF